MFRQKLLAVAAVAIVAAPFVATEASARHRHHRAAVVIDYCGGGMSSWGTDACGFPEFSYGDGCWKRVIVNTPEGPRAKRVRTCGRVVN